MKNVLFFLMAFLFECQIVAQEVIIRGSVADAADGSPLIGANVLVKGTSVGTITDVEGKFSLKVPKGTSKLTFSCVGYQEQEVALKANQTMLDVSMREDSELLDEVVVIGYGGAKKSDLTGAVSVLESSDLLDANPLSVSQGLQGKIAGVNVAQTDGAPGAGMNILIRGINSFSTSTEPLYVVDGVPFEGASSLINPSDIETLTVLKDASSTAIYGSRGANGVILITTKQGKRGNDRIEFSANYGFSNVLKRINVLDGPTYIRYRNEAVSNYMYYDNADDELPYPITGPGYYDPAQGYYRPSYEDFENGYLNGTGTDWQDVIYKTGVTQEYNLSISGASEKGNYSVSGGYYNQKGVIEGSGYSRISLRTNINRNLRDFIRVGTSTSVVRSVGDYVKASTSSNSVVRSALWYPSDLPIYDENIEGGFTRVDWLAANPYLQIRDSKDQTVTYNIFSSNYLEVDILKSLKFKQTAGVSYVGNNNYSYYGSTTLDGRNAPNGKASQSDSWSTRLVMESMLTYDKVFKKDHHLNVMAAFTAERSDYGSKAISVYDFDNDYLLMWNLGAAKKQNKPSSGRGMSSLASVLGRVNYNLKERYLFTASFRYDGSSKFSKDNRWAFFPSVALAWRASEESFIKDNIKWIDNLKLRLSYGTSGNRTSGRYATMAQMQNNSSYGKGYVYGDGAKGGLLQLMKTLPNPDLKWETTKSVNLGLDFSVLGGRLFGNYEFYVSKTSDLLYDVEIPHMNGMVTNSIPTNIGKLRNIGHEFSITGIPIVNKDFQWTITANFSLNKNKVESILGIDANKDGREDDLVASNIFIGEPLDPIYDYNIIGMWQVEDYNKGIIPDGFLYGTYKIEDVNHDNAYTAEDDRKILGYKDPLYRFSIQNNFTYKDFELNIFINSVQGGKNHYLGQPAGKLVIPDHLLSNSFMKFDYWTPENPDARYRQLGFYTNSLGSGFSPYISRSFVRLQELSLAYNLPKKFLSKIHVNRAKVFISASNLFTITGWDGWDPEAGQGISYDLDGGYPTMKSYTLGLNFEF